MLTFRSIIIMAAVAISFAVGAENGLSQSTAWAKHADEANERYDAGDYAKAVAAWDKAISLKSDFAPLFRKRALAKLGLRQLPQALADLDSAVRLDRSDHEAVVLRTSIHLEQQDLAKAAAEMKTAVDALGSEFGGGDRKTKGKYYAMLAAVYSLSGNNGEWFRYRSLAVSALSGGDSLETSELIEESWKHESKKLYGLALMTAAATSALDPDYKFGQVEEAMALSRMGQEAKAFSIMDKAFGIRTQNSARLHFFYGIALQSFEWRERAVAAFTKSLELFPTTDQENRRTVLLKRSETLCTLGKKTEAKKDEAEFVNLGGKLESPCR